MYWAQLKDTSSHHFQTALQSSQERCEFLPLPQPQQHSENVVAYVCKWELLVLSTCFGHSSGWTMPCCIQNSMRAQNERSLGWPYQRTEPLRVEMAMTAVQNEPFPTAAGSKQNPSIQPVQKKELAEDWWKYVYRQLIHTALTLRSLIDPQNTEAEGPACLWTALSDILKSNWMHQSHHTVFILVPLAQKY